MQSASGYLELFIGPMFSGKTSKLVELHKQYTFCNIPVLVINHGLDQRYQENESPQMSTHDLQRIDCCMLELASDALWRPDYTAAAVVLINEGQFFTDLYSTVVMMLHDGKRVYVAGLDGDFQRQKFGQVLDLVPMCDKVTKLVSLCSLCRNGAEAIFSKRLNTDLAQTVIGSADMYAPVCRACYK